MASRGQREREEEIYEVLPATITVDKAKGGKRQGGGGRIRRRVLEFC